MSYIAARRQQEKDRRRIEIIQAAEALYREIGWDAVSMDSVARRARLSRALVYVYFKDKRNLHFAIASRAMGALRVRFEEASSRSRTGIEKVEAIGLAYIAYAHEFPHYFDASARLEMHALDANAVSAQEQACMAAGHSVHKAIVDAIAVGQRDGTIRPDLGNLDITSRVLWGFTHGLIQIAITKAQPLAQIGIDVPQLTQHALTMLREMLKRN